MRNISQALDCIGLLDSKQKIFDFSKNFLKNTLTIPLIYYILISLLVWVETQSYRKIATFYGQFERTSGAKALRSSVTKNFLFFLTYSVIHTGAYSCARGIDII